MSLSFESTRMYVIILRVGGVWNLLASVPLLFLVPSLPTLIGVDPPTHPIFIYFNLMTVMMFGFIHFYVAAHLAAVRGMMVILMWSKILTAGIFAGAVLWLSMPGALIEFLAPGMAIDLIFGLIYLRYLFFAPAAEQA